MVLILLARQGSVFNSSVYARPRFFQTGNIAIGVSRSPTLMRHLLAAVWHPRENPRRMILECPGAGAPSAHAEISISSASSEKSYPSLGARRLALCTFFVHIQALF